MSDEFIRLYRYLEERFTKLERLIDQKADKTSVDALIVAVDGLYGRLDIVESELTSVVAHIRRVDRVLERHDREIVRHSKALESLMG